MLTDLQMPGMSGLELCERIVAQRPDVPVVVVTGHGTLESAIGAIRAGAYDFMQKPIKVETLQLTVERALRHHALSAEVQSAARSDAAGAVRRDHRTVVGDARGLRRHGARGADRRLGAAHRRERHRQGAGGARAACSAAAAPRVRSSRSTWRRCRSRSSSRSCSATRAAPSPTRTRRAPACSCRRRAARCSSTRSARCRCRCSPSCCARCRSARFGPVGGDHEMPIDVRIVAATNRDLETLRRRGALPRGSVLSHQRRAHRAAAVARARQRRAAVGAAGGRRASPRAWTRRCAGSRRRPRRSSSATSGRATCASCRTRSRAQWRSRASRRSPSRICRRRSATTTARTCSSPAAAIPTSCRRSTRSSSATSCA